MNKFITENNNLLIEVRILNKKIINNIYNINIGKESYNLILNKLKENNNEIDIKQNKYCYENIYLISENDNLECYKDTIQNYKQFKKQLVIAKKKEKLDIKYFPSLNEYVYNESEQIKRFNIDNNIIDLIYIPKLESYQCIIKGDSINKKFLDLYFL